MNPKPKRVVNRGVLDAEKEKPCVICGWHETDPAHIKTVKSGGGDEAFNVMPLCRRHHILQHQLGFVYLSRSYKTVLAALEERGWEIVKEFGREKLTRRK